MVHGKLEVLLVSAKGLEDTDFLSKPLFPLSLSLAVSHSFLLLRPTETKLWILTN